MRVNREINLDHKDIKNIMFNSSIPSKCLKYKRLKTLMEIKCFGSLKDKLIHSCMHAWQLSAVFLLQNFQQSPLLPSLPELPGYRSKVLWHQNFSLHYFWAIPGLETMCFIGLYVKICIVCYSWARFFASFAFWSSYSFCYPLKPYLWRDFDKSLKTVILGYRVCKPYLCFSLLSYLLAKQVCLGCD